MRNPDGSYVILGQMKAVERAFQQIAIGREKKVASDGSGALE